MGKKENKNPTADKKSDTGVGSEKTGASSAAGEGKKNWSAYNLAATTEKAHFQRLLYELCHGLERPPEKITKGRPRANFADLLFACVFKVYTALPSRRFMTDLEEAHEKGYISHVPHFNSISDFMREEYLPGYIDRLIVETGRVFSEVETIFAVDSTGLSRPQKVKYYNPRKRRVVKKRSSRKLHAICGVRTKIITAAVVTDGRAHDSPFFAPLVEKTGLLFNIDEVSADAGYTSFENQRIVLLHGGLPFIAYRANCSPYGNFKSSFWKRTLELFRNRDPEFMDRYYLRNNIESAFSMIKKRNLGRLLNKSKQGQLSEGLCIALCHNLCVINRAIHELGIAPAFWACAPPLVIEGMRERLKANLPGLLSPAFHHDSSNNADEKEGSAEQPTSPLQMQLFGEDSRRCGRRPPFRASPHSNPETSPGKSSRGAKGQGSSRRRRSTPN